jgi:hypothetical protein
MESSINKFSKLNDSIIKFLEKPILKYGLLIVIICHIIFIKNLSTSYLKTFDDNYFKVIYAFIIAYYACFDPIYSIALTTLMIISIQEIHSRNANINSNALIPLKNSNINSNRVMPNDSNRINESISSFIKNSTNDDKNNNKNDNKNYINHINNINNNSNNLLINDKIAYEIINKQILQKQPSPDDNLKQEYEFCDQPAFKTITDNLNEYDYENDNEINQDIKNLQNTSIQGLPGDIETIQGLPNGFNQKKIKINL